MTTTKWAAVLAFALSAGLTLAGIVHAQQKIVAIGTGGPGRVQFPPGGATEVMAFRVIEAAGLDKDKDMTRERLGAAESVNAIKDRKIDAFFWVGGIPTAAVTDLAATPGMKMKLIDHAEAVEKMNAKYGKLYTASKIKAGAYPGTDKDNGIAEVWNLIVTGDKK